MAKVSDFGLSKLLPENNAKGSMFPAEQAPAGTVTHMSPEALAEGALSTAADVYAFGIMSKRMLIPTYNFSLFAVPAPSGSTIHGP